MIREPDNQGKHTCLRRALPIHRQLRAALAVVQLLIVRLLSLGFLTSESVEATVLDATKGQGLAHVGRGKIVDGGHACLQAERDGPAVCAV